MIRKVVCILSALGCVTANGVEQSGNMNKCINGGDVAFTANQELMECSFDQEKLEEEDLNEDVVKNCKNQGIKNLQQNNIAGAREELIKAFFGNTYLENLYLRRGLENVNVSDNEVYWFYDNTCVGDKRVITYLLKILPNSVFWQKMRKFVYVPCGHY